MLGAPDQEVALGDTEVPFDLFMDYIYSLASSSFACVPSIHTDASCNADSPLFFLLSSSCLASCCSLPLHVHCHRRHHLQHQDSPDTYELFSHNCNNFSNELAMFLTGQEIPKHIVDLPNDILNS